MPRPIRQGVGEEIEMNGGEERPAVVQAAQRVCDESVFKSERFVPPVRKLQLQGEDENAKRRRWARRNDEGDREEHKHGRRREPQRVKQALCHVGLEDLGGCGKVRYTRTHPSYTRGAPTPYRVKALGTAGLGALRQPRSRWRIQIPRAANKSRAARQPARSAHGWHPCG